MNKTQNSLKLNGAGSNMTKDSNAQDSGYQAFSSHVAFFEDKHFERKNKIKKNSMQ